jgi:hypothetical protein
MNLEFVSATSVLFDAMLSIDALGGASIDGLAVEEVENVSIDLLIGGSGGGGGGGLGDLLRGCDEVPVRLGGKNGRSSGESCSCDGVERLGSFIDLSQFALTDSDAMDFCSVSLSE